MGNEDFLETVAIKWLNFMQKQLILIMMKILKIKFINY